MPTYFFVKLLVSLVLIVNANPNLTAEEASGYRQLHPYLKFFNQADVRELRYEFEKAKFIGIPKGSFRGYVKSFSSRWFDLLELRLINFFWRGMDFEQENALVLNKMRGLPHVFAILYEDVSPLDQKPSLMVDYSETLGLMAARRDEIRQVAESVLLARSYNLDGEEFRLDRYYLLIRGQN